MAYLLGVPRSGTTLLSLALNQHPEISCPPEPWLMLALQSLGAVPAGHPAQAILLRQAISEFLGADASAVLGACARAVYRTQLRRDGRKLFVDKTPRYYQCLDFIRACLPEAKYVWISRNPLDVAASYKTTWDIDFVALMGSQFDDPYLFDFAFGLRRLVEFVEQIPACAVRYENLVRNPKLEVSRVFRHLDVADFEIDLRMDVSSSRYSSTSFGDRNILMTPQVHSGSVDNYRTVLSAPEISSVLSGLGRDLFERLGYAREFDEAAELSGRPVVDRSAEMADLAGRFLRDRQEYDRSASYQPAALRAALESDRSAKDDLIRSLSEQIAAVEADRALKDEVAGRLSADLKTVEDDRALKGERLSRLAAELEAVKGDRAAKDDVIRRLMDQLDEVERDRRQKDGVIQRLLAELQAAKAELEAAKAELQAARDEAEAAQELVRKHDALTAFDLARLSFRRLRGPAAVPGK